MCAKQIINNFIYRFLYKTHKILGPPLAFFVFTFVYLIQKEQKHEKIQT